MLFMSLPVFLGMVEEVTIDEKVSRYMRDADIAGWATLHR